VHADVDDAAPRARRVARAPRVQLVRAPVSQRTPLPLPAPDTAHARRRRSRAERRRCGPRRVHDAPGGGAERRQNRLQRRQATATTSKSAQRVSENLQGGT
jgi:hypothetical protein